MKNCPTCRFRTDYSDYYWSCSIRDYQPQPLFVDLYNTRGPLLIARKPFEDEKNPIHDLTLQDCPAWIGL